MADTSLPFSEFGLAPQKAPKSKKTTKGQKRQEAIRLEVLTAQVAHIDAITVKTQKAPKSGKTLKNIIAQ